ncbi:PRY2 [Brettanomyces bruxellensis]|uniref:DEBR0S7_02190g1_1 n=1 Tax=Dekkera bruxellensis TaxID=5007 RepID=A0A7D9D0F6_DEKBR|nr:PRY2 [Brettanomyces bruxellensis]
MKSLSAIALAAFIGLQRVYASDSCVINYHTVTTVEYVYKPYPSDFTSQFSAVKSSASQSSEISTLDDEEDTTTATSSASSSSSLTTSSSSEVATSSSASSSESASSESTSSVQLGFVYNPSTSSSESTTSSSSLREAVSTSASSTSASSTSTSESSTSESSTSKPSTSSTTSKSSTSTSSTPSTSSSKTTSKSSSSTSSTAASTSTGFDFAQVYLDMHNKYRSLHEDTPDMTWNSGVAAVAQTYADSYSCDGVLSHSGNKYNGSGLGENLAYGYDFDDAGAVTAWYDEISDYNYDDPGFSEKTGHFTQVVWKSSTELGCGYKYCGSYYGYYIVCNYLPQGNIVSSGSDSAIYFEENVLPLKS